MSLFLIGSRGCGKSTIGRKLADRLWQTFLDIDELIVKRAGKTIKDIFEQDGEEHFRNLETAILGDLVILAEHIVALGGGTVLREQNRQMIRDSGHKVVYLRCDPQELHRRIQADPQTAATRPALTKYGGSLEEVRELLERREPLYREVMTAELDVTHLTPEEACVHISRMM